MREDKAITMILSNLVWYRADEVLPDPIPEDVDFLTWNDEIPHQYLVVTRYGIYLVDWCNGWNVTPNSTAKRKQIAKETWSDIIFWTQLPDGDDLLKEVLTDADM